MVDLGSANPAQSSNVEIAKAQPAAYGREFSDKDAPKDAPLIDKAQVLSSETGVLELLRELGAPVANSPGLEVVLIDSRVPDLETLKTEFNAQIAAGRHLAVLVIDTQTDGLDRATQMLAAAGQPVSAIHIVSHGQGGAFQLGSSLVNETALEQHSAQLASWSRYLDASADVFLYGCDVAASTSGQHFVERLAELTGADVAASSNRTGAIQLGGDWDLEYHSGQIEQSSIATHALQEHWQGLLNEIVVNTTTGGNQDVGSTSSNGRNIGVNSHGDAVIVWQDLGTNRVVARAFSTDGTARTGEITVMSGGPTSLRYNVSSPSVAVREDGSFIVTWVKVDIAAKDQVCAQRFTAEGIALGPVIDVDGPTTQYDQLREPEIDVGPDGSFVIVYQVQNSVSLTSDYDVRVSGFDKDGTAKFNNVLVDSDSAGYEGNASVTVRTDGSFVVVWTDYQPVSSSNSIGAQVFDPNGTALGARFFANTTGAGDQSHPSVDSAADNSFAVAYVSDKLNATSLRIGTDILVQRFSANATPSGVEMIFHGYLAGQLSSNYVGPYNSAPSLTMSDNGGIAVAWIESSTTAASDGLVFVRAVDASNADIQSDGLVSGGSSSAYTEPSIAYSGAGGAHIGLTYSRASGGSGNPTDVAYRTDDRAFAAVPPGILIPLTQNTLEDSPLPFSLTAGNAIQISDTDAGGSDKLMVSVSIVAGQGTLSIADTSLIRGVFNQALPSNYSGAVLAFVGTRSNLNLALAQLTFNPTVNWNGTVQVHVTVVEAYGGALFKADDAYINVTAVNDAPTTGLPTTAISVDQGTSITLTGSTGFTIADVDAGTSPVSFALTARHGIPTITGTAGVSVSTIDFQSGADRVRGFTLTGALSDINSTLASLTYQADASYEGIDVLATTLNDQGNSGTGGVLIDTQSVNVTVNHVNVTPSITWGTVGAPTIAEDSSSSLLSMFGGSGIVLSDSDAASTSLQLTINATNGMLEATTSIAGLLYGPSMGALSNQPVVGPISGSSFEVRGNLTQLNSFLSILSLRPTSDFYGTSNITIVVDDLQATPTSISTVETRAIQVRAVNDAPVLSIATVSSSAIEDTPKALSSLFSTLSFSDVDAGTLPMKLTVSVDSGGLRLNTSGLNLSDPSTLNALTGTVSSTSGALSIRGNLSDLNAALNAMVYVPAINLSGNVNINFAVDDLGNFGALVGGVSGTTTQARSFTLSPVNDAALVNLSLTSMPVVEDTPTKLGQIFTTINVADVDAGTSDVQLTLTVNSGSLSIAGTGLRDTVGSPIGGNLSGASITFRADLTSLNAALQNVLFTPPLNANGSSFTLTMTPDDLGNTGAGGPGSTSTAVTRSFSVSAVNDAPMFSAASSPVAPILVAINENSTFVQTVSASDIDSASISFSILPSLGTDSPLFKINASTGVLEFNAPPDFENPGDTDRNNAYEVTVGASDGVTTTTQYLRVSVLDVREPVYFSSGQTASTLVPQSIPLPASVFGPPSQAPGVIWSISDSSGQAISWASLNTPSMTVEVNAPYAAVGTNSLIVRAIDAQGLIGEWTLVLNVQAVNRAPVNMAPVDANGVEDTGLIFSVSQGNSISISDPDGNVIVEVNLSVGNGSLTLNASTGLSFSSGDGTSDAQMSLRGTVNSINAALDGLRFDPSKDFNGHAVLSMTTTDLGNSGVGGPKSSQSQTNLHIASVNDAPVVQITRDFTQIAGNPSSLGVLDLLTTDVDSGPTQIAYTLDAALIQGDLLLNGKALGLGDRFTQYDINSGALKYQSGQNASGTELIQLSVRDESAAAAPAIQIKVTIQPNLGLTSASGGGSSAGTATGVVTTTAGLTSLAKADAKALTDTSSSVANVLVGTNIAPGGGTAAAPPSGPSASTDKAGSNAGSSGNVASARTTGSAGADTAALARLDASRLPDSFASPLNPLTGQTPIAAASNAAVAEREVKAIERENPDNKLAGFILPSQAISLDRIISDNVFQGTMKQVRDDVMQVSSIDRGVVASSIGVSASFTIGYLIWLVRGGVLISSLLASLPAWRLVDPLPVLGKLGGTRRDKDDQSLEELVNRKDTSPEAQSSFDEDDFDEYTFDQGNHAHDKHDSFESRRLEGQAASS